MARPCKAMGTTSKNWTKEEYKQRKTAEDKLKGGANKIKPPSYLSNKQKKIFNYIVEELKASEILSNLDIYILCNCSIAIDRLQEIESKINNDITELTNKDLMSAKDKYTKDLYRSISELSLSPQSRAKLANLNVQTKTTNEDLVLKAVNKKAGGE